MKATSRIRGKVLHEEIRHQDAEVRGDELSLFQLDVFPVLDRAEDRGVGAGPADAVFLQFADERGLGEAGRRLGELLLRRERDQFQDLPLPDIGQELAEAVLLAVLLLALRVDDGESGKLHDRSLRPEEAVGGRDVHGGLVQEGRVHLAGQEPVPDELVETELVGRQVLLDRLGRIGQRRGPDRLVGVLGLPGDLEDPRLGGQVRRIVIVPDVLPRLVDRLGGDADGVGPHVGDQADGPLGAELDPFVEPLGGRHRFFRRKAEPAGGLLLELAGRKGGGRLALDLLLFDRGDGEGGILQRGHDLGGALGVADLRLLPVDLGQFGLEGGRIRSLQEGGEVPVLLGDERADLRLPVADDPEGDGLDPAGGEPPLHLFPEDGADLIADEPVEDPPGLLRLVPVEVEVAGVGDRLEDRVLGEVVEEDAPDDLSLPPISSAICQAIASPSRSGSGARRI